MITIGSIVSIHVILWSRSGWFQFEFDVEMLSFYHLLISLLPAPYFEWRSGPPCSMSSIGIIISSSFYLILICQIMWNFPQTVWDVHNEEPSFWGKRGQSLHYFAFFRWGSYDNSFKPNQIIEHFLGAFPCEALSYPRLCLLLWRYQTHFH